MSSWIPISRSEHVDTYWQAPQNYNATAEQNVITVLLPELSNMISHYVLAFTKVADQYQLVALLSLSGGRNLYLGQEGQWLCPYIPAALRSNPFTLANNASGDKIMCVDENALTDDPQAKALVDGEGNLAPPTAQVFEFLNHCEQGRVMTQAACKSLADAGLIDAWPLTLGGEDGQKTVNIEGLHRINATALDELKASALAKLRKSGALPLAYAQLFSMNQLPVLRQRYTAAAKPPVANNPMKGLSPLFQEEGTLNFDSLFGDDDLKTP
ncbi:MAG: SapC family protein [Pseudohongiellaceae bacterium]